MMVPFGIPIILQHLTQKGTIILATTHIRLLVATLFWEGTFLRYVAACLTRGLHGNITTFFRLLPGLSLKP